MASTNQQITANLYQVFATDTTGNITTLGISNISTGNLTANGNVQLGAIANVHVTGGLPGQLLTTDGAGNLSFVTISAATGNIAGLNLNGLGNTYLAGNGAWLTFPTASYGNIVNTNYSGNGLQVLAGNGVWVASPQGNIANTNYTGNAQQYLNGAGQWTGIPGINVGNVAYANFTGNVSQVLTGSNTWTTISNVATATFNGNASTVLSGANTWVSIPALSSGNIITANFTGNSAQVLTGANTWIPMASGNVGNVGNVAYANFTGNSLQVLTGANTWTTISGTITYPSPANSQLFLNGSGGWSVPAGGGGGITYPGNIQQWLRGDGTWANIAIPVVGNVAYANFNGNPNTYLTGSNTWANSSQIRTSLGLGNVANTYYSGNIQQWLRGDGTWANIAIPTVGSIGSVNLNNNASTVLSGTGSWVPLTTSGNIGGINLNGNTFTFLNGAGLWSNISVPVVGNVAYSNFNGNANTVLSGNGAWIPTNTGGNVGQLNLNGNANSVLSGTGSWTQLGTVAALNLNGQPLTFLSGSGAWMSMSTTTPAAGSNTWIQYNTGGRFDANSLFTYDSATNTMTAANANIGMLSNLKTATESVNLVSIAPTGTYVLYALNNSIAYTTAASTTSIALSITGSPTQQLNSLMSIGQSITVTYILTNASVANKITSVLIDGIAPASVMWLGGLLPAPGTMSRTFYSFTIIKVTATAFNVFASAAEYK